MRDPITLCPWKVFLEVDKSMIINVKDERGPGSPQKVMDPNPFFIGMTARDMEKGGGKIFLAAAREIKNTYS